MDSPSETRSPATHSDIPSRDVSVDVSTPVPSTPDQASRPPVDDVLEQRILEDSFDTDAWLTILHEAEREGEVSRVRDAYERFLKVFPTSVSPYSLQDCHEMELSLDPHFVFWCKQNKRCASKKNKRKPALSSCCHGE